ncbi:MAG: hypothetical protein IT330_02370 [Anaerolineae bacterium]|nr:hypothetical protein [Anaerolineae bacterium]
MKPSKLRLIVAWYLDLLLWSAILYVGETALGFYRYHWPVAVAASLSLEALLWRLEKRSFGFYAMGLVRDENGRWVLDPELKANAHWLILALGIFQFYSGHRIFAEGLVTDPFFYLLGTRLPRPLSQLFLGLLGMAWMYSAAALFRCKMHAPRLVLTLQAFILLNDLASLPLLRELVEDVIARGQAERVAMGRTPAPTTPEMLMQLNFAGNLVYLIVLVAVVLVFRKRFRFEGLA